ncbi:hypothetical protein D3C83_267780 [compost metagenome]
MIRQLDHLDELVLDRFCDEIHAAGAQAILVVVVELEAVTVTLADDLGVVQRTRT